MVKTPNQLIADHKKSLGFSIHLSSIYEMNRVPTRLNCAGDLRPPATTKTQAPGPWACEMDAVSIGTCSCFLLEKKSHRKRPVPSWRFPRKHGRFGRSCFFDRFTHGFCCSGTQKRVGFFMSCSSSIRLSLHSNFGQKHCGFEDFRMECPFFWKIQMWNYVSCLERNEIWLFWVTFELFTVQRESKIIVLGDVQISTKQDENIQINWTILSFPYLPLK